MLPLRPRLKVSAELPAPTDSLDWLFWLREAPLPARWATDATVRTWQEASAPISQFATAFQPPASANVLAVAHLDTLAQPGALTVWPTAAGRPLLSWQPPGRYQLHSRLDAAWSALADSPELPALLLPLLLPATPAAFQPDSRQLALSQLRGPVAAEGAPVSPTVPRQPLAPWLVLGAGLLFLVERLVAARQTAGTSPTLSPSLP